MHEQRRQQASQDGLLGEDRLSRGPETHATLYLSRLQRVAGDDFAGDGRQLVQDPLRLRIAELDHEEDVRARGHDGQGHQGATDAGIGVAKGDQCTLPVRCRGDNGGMDQNPVDLEPTFDLADLMKQLENADPAEAPEIAAQVADELQRRLRG